MSQRELEDFIVDPPEDFIVDDQTLLGEELARPNMGQLRSRLVGIRREDIGGCLHQRDVSGDVFHPYCDCDVSGNVVFVALSLCLIV